MANCCPMNKPTWITTLIVVLIGVLFLPLFVAAAPSIIESEITLEVDYSQFSDDDDDILSTSTSTFTITNDGSTDLTVIVDVTGLPSGYDAEPKEVLIPANSSKNDVSIVIDVPHKKDPGVEKIGTIIIKDQSNIQLDSAELVQDTAQMLELEELEIKYTDYKGKSQKEEFKDEEDGTYTLNDELRPYTEVTLTFQIKNRFDSHYKDEGALDEIQLTIDANDDHLFEESLKDQYDIESIEAGKKGEYVVTFTINKEIDAEKYNLDLSLTAEDGQGVEYELEKELELEVQLDDDDVRLTQAEVPAAVTACADGIDFKVELYNFGTDLQKSVGLSITNEELGINENVKDIELKSYNKDPNYWTKTFTFELAKKPKVKTYYLDIVVYLNGDLEIDRERVELPIKTCTSGVIEEEEEEVTEETAGQEQETTAAPEKTTSETNSSVVKSVEKISYTASDYITALLVIAIVVVAVMVVLLIVALFR
ncbi:MAG TPA: hypothetical protein VJA18_04600 [Candidatus Nanoarchaeia archaeon]|nr:hypothetical protein [Candidatus Nanoarchaeia archaeon]